MTSAHTVRIPRIFWFVVVIALAWTVFGAGCYILTQAKNEAYLARFTDAQTTFIAAFPTWLVVFWALGVWGGLFGSVLLLFRKSLAVPVFMVCLLCVAVTTVHNYGVGGAADVFGIRGLVYSAVSVVVALGLYLFSRQMEKKRVLL